MAQYRTGGGPAPERRPLTDKALAAYLASRAQSPAPETKAVADDGPCSAPFLVERTRKGHWAVRVERRAKGKQVTVVRNVRGDAEALLDLLRRGCGAGGVARDGMVEVQGDHRAKVEAILRAL